LSGLLPTPPLWQRPSAASVATHGWLARWTNRVAWTGAESSGGGPLLDGVSTFLGDGGLGQRDREPLGSRGLWFLGSTVLSSGSGAGVMAGVWRGVLCTHAVMVARRTFHGGGSVGALAVDGRRSRGRGPVWCAPRGTRRATRSTHVRGARAVGARTGVRTGGTRRPPAVRPMLMLHCPWACAPLPIFYRPITENKPQTAPLVCSMDLLPLSGAPRAIKLSSIRRPSRGKGAMVGACALLTSDVRARQLATTAAHRASQDKHGPVRFPML